MAHVLSYAGRINGLTQAHMLQIVAAKVINNECSRQAAQGIKSEGCDRKDMNETMNTFNKEIFDRTAEYRTQKSVAKFLFCEKTNKQLGIEPFNNDWWQATNEQSETLLAIMQSEIGCKNF
ncbi:hypothetical protein SG34_023920 [Thalassomonas viridans]|uniref:Uncharacterized protein n=1 Tax=Thalassomonas viridans TaxID=137584 RepID=A0AAE9Z1L5_9GAMM|nr:hypothetical protein [Thalassomonas viridans]WDE04355.1 hypothetical protein SG34_023920 [Thalassomonas viridans]